MERIVKILSLRKEHEGFLDLEDFRLLVESVLETHPGLEFLADSPEFGDRYVQTVLYRIFYVINASNTGRITARELRKSNFVKVLHLLDAEDDINKVTDYFSYRHFYVIYTSFWKPVFETREPPIPPSYPTICSRRRRAGCFVAPMLWPSWGGEATHRCSNDAAACGSRCFC